MEKDIALGKKIFRQHSITYYYSTFLFPKQVREKVYILYGFVRLADELVDNPQENPKEALHRFMVKVDKTWNEGVIEDECDEEQQMISAFVRLAKREYFEKQWVDAFLTSMQMDLTIQTYDSMEDLDVYIYGSACVIGLMMAKIMGVPNEGLSYAEQLGRLMQLINFLRDIKEDAMRKRIYIPSSYLKEVGLMTEEWYYPPLDNRYTSVLQKMITYIDTVEKDVQPGFTYIPNSCIFAVELATKNYLSIFYQIKQNPNIVFEKSLRSNKWMMLKDFICLRIHYLWRK